MLLHILVHATLAFGGEVVSLRPFAVAPRLQYRENLRVFLRLPRYRTGLPALRELSAGLRGATVIQITLEEIHTHVEEWRSKTGKSSFPAVTYRLFQEMAVVHLGTVTEAEREELRLALKPYVDLYYRDRRAAGALHHAVGLYDQLSPRGLPDVEYLIQDVRTMPYLIGGYARILSVASELDALRSNQLREAILHNPGKALVRWCILDELGWLPEEYLRGALDLLAHELLPKVTNEISDVEARERQIYLKALARWQARYRDGEASFARAFDGAVVALMKRDHLEEEARFLNRFARGLLPTELSSAALLSTDPLGLRERFAAVENVVALKCAGRLDPFVAPL